MSVADETEWCHQGGTAGDYSLAAAVFQTIDEDVNRTNVESSAERERVRRVLRAFAMKNPRTGYCQVGDRYSRVREVLSFFPSLSLLFLLIIGWCVVLLCSARGACIPKLVAS